MILAPPQPLEHRDLSAAIDSTVPMARVSVAEKELGELRALGLAKAISSRGLESSSTHTHKKKEDDELKALKDLGLTSAKTKFPNHDSPVPENLGSSDELIALESSLAKEQVSLGEKGLVHLRALGLAKAMSSQGVDSGSSHVHMKKEDEELEALRGLGLTSYKAKELPVESTNPCGEEQVLAKGQVSSAEKELGELRVMGLAKAISSRGLECGSSHVLMKKEDEELKALRGLGLTSSKHKHRMDDEPETVVYSEPSEDRSAGSEPSAIKEMSVSSAAKELGELRALGLTKNVASKGFESEWHPSKRKEEKELAALQGLGLTSAKAHPPKNESIAEERVPESLKPSVQQHASQPSAIPEKRTSAQIELGELRALGLTKIVASKGYESEWQPNKRKKEVELNALKGLGLTSAKNRGQNDYQGKDPATETVEPRKQLVLSEPAVGEEKISSAAKELGELRALGLTKNVASKGFESEWHPSKRKEEEELRALKGLGLTSAKAHPPKSERPVEQPAVESLESSDPPTESPTSLPAAEKRTSAQIELGELRELGLTKVIASKGFESEWQPEMKKEDGELKKLRALSFKTNERFTSA